MACKGLPLINDKVGRCTEKPKIPDSQSLGGGTCSLVFHHIHHNVLGEVILQNQYIMDDGFLLERHRLLDGHKINMQQLPRPTTGQGFHRCYWWGCLIFPTVTAFLDAVSEVTSHTQPPEAFLHKSYGVTLTLMSRLLVATIKGGALMPLRNYKFEHDLVSLSLLGLLVQEAVFDQ